MVVFLLILFLVIIAAFGTTSLLKYWRAISETNKKIEWAEKRHYTLLKIMVPKNNSKSPLAAEQMFAALHGIYRASDPLQEHFSFEIAATNQSINFYMLVPTHLRDFIEGQVYSQYPTVEIEATTDYSNVDLTDKYLAGADLTLVKTDFYPIRTFANFDVDPLAGITGVLSKVDDGELLTVQAVMSPIDDSWHKEGLDYVAKIKEGKQVGPPPPLHKELRKQGSGFMKSLGKDLLTGVFANGGEVKKEEKKEIRLSGPEDAALKGIEAKVTKLGFAIAFRVMAVTGDENLSRTRVESVVGAFKQFNLTNLNGFQVGPMESGPEFLRKYRSRSLGSQVFRFNVEEIASLFHFPDMSVETPNIVWAGSKKGEPPQNLPIEGEIPSEELTTYGLTSFRNRKTKFGIKKIDRRLHFYIIGKTGTGKSTLIENMIYDDIKEGRGVAVVDPHGELIEHILNFIPEDRINDVVYFNPDDREYPLAFNLLESIDGDMRSIVASGLMSIFTKLWANVWSARMEYILRNAILAVLEVPDSTLLSIMRLLNDTTYRKYVESIITDPVVKDFLVNEYDKYDAKFRQEAIAPIQNKVGQFLSSSTIRNLVGQPQSTFNLNEIMDTGKIFLVNLSIGRIGEDNSKLLGSMIITKIQLAAMSRARIAAEQRRDFYLYVDEFQNFATDSFATILSEARKYHLNLVLANQYIAQIPEIVADAIFGNVGTMVSFRVGPDDGTKLVTQFQPVFEINDLINLPNRQIYAKMAIDGVTSQAFSAFTLPPRGLVTNHVSDIIEQSRRKYSRDRVEVEAKINASAEADYRPPIEKEYDQLREHPFVIDGTLYKEFSSRGGQKWYFGQPPEVLEAEGAEEAASPVPVKTESTELAKPEQRQEIIEAKPAPLPAKPAPKQELAKSEPAKPKELEYKDASVPKKQDLVIIKKEEESRGEVTPKHEPPKPVEHKEIPEEPKPEPVFNEQVSGQMVAPRPTTINRGHQHDDWLPLEEL